MANPCVRIAHLNARQSDPASAGGAGTYPPDSFFPTVRFHNPSLVDRCDGFRRIERKPRRIEARRKEENVRFGTF